MRRYELMLLLRPDLEDDKLQAAVEKVTRTALLPPRAGTRAPQPVRGPKPQNPTRAAKPQDPAREERARNRRPRRTRRAA